MLKIPSTLSELLKGKEVDAEDYIHTSLEGWAVKGKLGTVYLREMALEEGFRELLKELAKPLADKNVHPLVLGGISFWDDFYEPGTRRVYDLDLWISPEEYEATTEVLGHHGFKQDEKFKASWFRNRLEIDLHTHAINSFRSNSFSHLFNFDVKEIYERGEALPVCPEKPWRRPQGEDLWILHALHAIKHEYERLNLILDLHFILEKQQPQSELGKKCWAAVTPVLKKTNINTPLSSAKSSALAEKILLPKGQRPFLAGLRLMASLGKSPMRFWLSLAKGNKKVHHETGGIFKRYKRMLERL